MADDPPSNLTRESRFSDKANISENDDVSAVNTMDMLSKNELHHSNENVKSNLELFKEESTGNAPVASLMTISQIEESPSLVTYNSLFTNSEEIPYNKSEIIYADNVVYHSGKDLHLLKDECGNTINNSETYKTILDNKLLNISDKQCIEQSRLKTKCDSININEDMYASAASRSTELSSLGASNYISYSQDNSSKNFRTIIPENSAEPNKVPKTLLISMKNNNVSNMKNIEIQMSPVKIRIAATLGEDSVTHIDESMEVDLDGLDSDPNDPEEPSADAPDDDLLGLAEPGNVQDELVPVGGIAVAESNVDTQPSSSIQIATEGKEIEVDQCKEMVENNDVNTTSGKEKQQFAQTRINENILPSAKQDGSGVSLEDIDVDEGVDVSEEMNDEFREETREMSEMKISGEADATHEPTKIRYSETEGDILISNCVNEEPTPEIIKDEVSNLASSDNKSLNKEVVDVESINLLEVEDNELHTEEQNKVSYDEVNGKGTETSVVDVEHSGQKDFDGEESMNIEKVINLSDIQLSADDSTTEDSNICIKEVIEKYSERNESETLASISVVEIDTGREEDSNVTDETGNGKCVEEEDISTFKDHDSNKIHDNEDNSTTEERTQIIENIPENDTKIISEYQSGSGKDILENRETNIAEQKESNTENMEAESEAHVEDKSKSNEVENKDDEVENTIDEDSNMVDKDVNKVDIDENKVDEDEHIVDEDENKVDVDENKVNEDEHKIDEDENKVDEDENKVEEDEHKEHNDVDVHEDENKVDEDENKVDEIEHHKVDKEENKVDVDKNKIDVDESNIDEDENKIDEEEHKGHEDENKINEDEHRVDADEHRVDEDENKVDVDENKVDVDENKVNEDEDKVDEDEENVDEHENKVDEIEHKISEDENKVDVDEDKVDEDEDKVDENEEKVDEDEHKVDEDENKVDVDKNKVDVNESNIDEDENKVNKDKHNIVDEEENKVDEIEHKVDEDENKVDEDGNNVDEEENKVDEDENKVDEDENKTDVDENNKVDEDEHKVNEDENKVAEDGNKDDEDENKVDEDENIVDEDENKVDEDENKVDGEKEKVHEDENKVDEDENKVDEDENKVDGDEHIFDEDEHIVDEDENKVDVDKNKVDEDENKIDEDENKVDEDENKVDEDENKDVEDENLKQDDANSCDEKDVKEDKIPEGDPKDDTTIDQDNGNDEEKEDTSGGNDEKLLEDKITEFDSAAEVEVSVSENENGKDTEIAKAETDEIESEEICLEKKSNLIQGAYTNTDPQGVIEDSIDQAVDSILSTHGEEEIEDSSPVERDDTAVDADAIHHTQDDLDGKENIQTENLNESNSPEGVEEMVEALVSSTKARELSALPVSHDDQNLDNLSDDTEIHQNLHNVPKVISPRKGIKVEEDEIETAISSVQFYDEVASANEDVLSEKEIMCTVKDSDSEAVVEHVSTKLSENELEEPTQEVCAQDIQEQPSSLQSPSRTTMSVDKAGSEDAQTLSVSPKKRKKKRKTTRSRSTSQKGNISTSAKKTQEAKAGVAKSGQLDKAASRSGSSSTTRSSSAVEKKIPPIKTPVGNAPPPKVKQARSKIGSLENVTHKPKGGERKVESVKLEWNAKSKVGSLDYATHKPGGGDKKIITQKVDFKNVQSKVGSKDNLKHKPGGGNLKVATEKLDFKSKAASKVGSLENAKHKPGGGNVAILSEKLHFKEKAAPKILSRSGSETGSHGGSEIGSPVPPSSPAPPEGMPPLCEDDNPSSQEEDKKEAQPTPEENNVQNQMNCNGGTGDSGLTHLQGEASPVTSQHEIKDENIDISPSHDDIATNEEDNAEDC